MTAPVTRDPYLALPLDGVRLIEASAGTGKTFTLATLFTRLVVERQWRIGQILAVTFTDAAAQELRKRIRERLALAASLVGTAAAADDNAEVQLTRAIVQRHLDNTDESEAALARRLQLAADEIDLAAIFTIHSFCARVLREHALESGHGFDPPELLGSERELHAELAADLWRVHAAEPAGAERLLQLWSNPDALARDLAALIGPSPLFPEPAPSSDDPRPAHVSAARDFAAAFSAHGKVFMGEVCAAVEKKVLNGNSYKLAWLEPLAAQLHGWAASDDPAALRKIDPDHLRRLTADKLKARTNKAHAGMTPASPLQHALDAWLVADDALRAWQAQQRVQLLHQLRDEARQRLAELKRIRRVQSYDDLINGVADALEGEHRAALVQRLREQYCIALVDEFQDTDDRQWHLFARVFGPSEEVLAAGLAPALFLIGDPKQAIYGFRGGDVHTYLKAKAVAHKAPSLTHNFRSRPGVLRAIETLYTAAGERAFLEDDIRFESVQPGDKRQDSDFLRHGVAAPALTVWQAPPADDGKDHDAGASQQLATQACVAAIHQLLGDAREGRALIDGKPVQAGDIAVLVRKHQEATRIQQALAAVGIPAVAAGKQSLFASDEARELRVLLLALLQPADDSRLRAALATVLLGVDAAGVAALEHDGDALRLHQHALLEWRERWQRSGPFALISDLGAQHAERLLALLDGERRLTNYLQLGELLQQASARALGLHGLLDWLQVQITNADPNDEAQLLRLESDALRVQIVTLHKSKGLEYPVVFLPFIGIGSRSGLGDRRHCTVYQHGERQLHWKIHKDDDAWQQVSGLASHEQRAEDARLLYVGLTRAEHALWVASGRFYNHGMTPLAPMVSNPDALRGCSDVQLSSTQVQGSLPALAIVDEGELPPVRAVTRAIAHDWWVYSFTQLANADSGHDTAAAATEDSGAAADEPVGSPATTDGGEETAAVVEPYDPRFGGSRFGNVLHNALENSDFAAWHAWQPGDAAPPGQGEVLREALIDESYPEEDLIDGLAVMTQLVGQTLTVALPEGGALHAVPVQARRAEIEFHFALQPTSVPALLQLLHGFGVVRDRHGFGLRRQLEGLMTGKIDLTYQQQGRWYVLDYKSNRLPSYEPARLQRAMAHSEYDLQALIYTVALHRWLRFRVGNGYDYARDFGGIRYLFCRGLDARRADSPGVYAHRFDPALVSAMDELFAGGPRAHAAMLARMEGQA